MGKPIRYFMSPKPSYEQVARGFKSMLDYDKVPANAALPVYVFLERVPFSVIALCPQPSIHVLEFDDATEHHWVAVPEGPHAGRPYIPKGSGFFLYKAHSPVVVDGQPVVVGGYSQLMLDEAFTLRLHRRYHKLLSEARDSDNAVGIKIFPRDRGTAFREAEILYQIPRNET